MNTANISVLKKELGHCTNQELIELCLRLAKFKKENKELLTYLLFEAQNEDLYISSVKTEMDFQFAEINTSSYYFIKKSVRKILSSVKKHIRYSQHKETEIALLIYFCKKLSSMKPSFRKNIVLTNTFNTQLRMIQIKIKTLHEDLQYDYNLELEEYL
jgi:hypothetical protein